MALEVSPWMMVSIFAVIAATLLIMNKQRIARLAPLELLAEDAVEVSFALVAVTVKV